MNNFIVKRIGFFFIIAISSSQLFGQGFVTENFPVPQRFLNRFEDRQLDLSFRRIGAKALGMGGANVAISQSAAAALWNPAGLTQMSGLDVSFGGSFNLNTQDIILHEFAGRKIISDIEAELFPTFASLHYPITIGDRRLTAGVVYHRWRASSQKITDGHFIYPTGNIDLIQNPNDNLYSFSPSLALDLISGFSLGASFHVLNGASEYDFTIQSPFIDETVFYSLQDKESLSGSFAIIGVLAKPTSWLSLGATVRPAWQFTVKEEQETQFIPDESSAIDTIATAAEALDRFELDIPLFYTVGVALHPSSHLTLAFDFEAQPWADAELSANGSSTPMQFSDSHSLRFGLEYMAKTKWAEVPLRIGYYTNPSPYKDRFFRGEYLGKQIEEGVFTFGTGIEKKTWTLNLALERGRRDFDWWIDTGDFYNDRISTTEQNFTEITLTTGFRF